MPNGKDIESVIVRQYTITETFGPPTAGDYVLVGLFFLSSLLLLASALVLPMPGSENKETPVKAGWTAFWDSLLS